MGRIRGIDAFLGDVNARLDPFSRRAGPGVEQAAAVRVEGRAQAQDRRGGKIYRPRPVGAEPAMRVREHCAGQQVNTRAAGGQVAACC